MGQDNPEERYDTGNVMRNLLQSDYLVFPNLYMEEKMSGAYNLKELYQGTVLHEGYPRNCIFFHPEQGTKLKELLGYAGTQLSIYMPTFRGTSSSVQEEDYVNQIKDYLNRVDILLHENQIMLVKLHPFVQSQLTLDSYRHIRLFPEGYDTYEVLNACDVLITDYSSVMYDFAVTGRRILLFAYDLEYYQGSRGMYEDISDYPFPLVRTPEELVKELNTDSDIRMMLFSRNTALSNRQMQPEISVIMFFWEKKYVKVHLCPAQLKEKSPYLYRQPSP